MLNRFPGGFAVLMAVYRRDDPVLFRRALQSVFENSLRPDEVWVVADGPLTPELEEVVADFLEDKVTLLHLLRLPENRGLARALNAGLATISLPWVVRADADDINMPGRFAAQAAMVERQPEMQLMSGYILEVTPAGERLGVREVPLVEREILRYAKSRNPFNHMAVAYRRDKVLEVGGYPAIHLKEDYALWCKMLAAKAHVANIPEVLVHATAGKEMYRRRGGWKYAKAEWAMQRLLVKSGLKSGWRAAVDGLVRATIFLAPSSVRGWVYKHLLRKRP